MQRGGGADGKVGERKRQDDGLAQQYNPPAQGYPGGGLKNIEKWCEVFPGHIEYELSLLFIFGF